MSRRSTYDYLKQRRVAFANQVTKVLGSRCEVCGNEAATRIEFRDLHDPYRKRYSSNRVTLFRKVLDGEYNSRNLILLCGDCWIDYRREHQ